MDKVLDWILEWPAFKGRRTEICQKLLSLLVGYQALVAAKVIPAYVSQELLLAVITALTAYAAKFAKEHKPG